jgi:ArsR family transcriptional regulator
MQIDPILRALADPTRLRIMRLLTAMELAVGELAQVLGQSQPRVSRHVKILCDAGLAERRKEGSWVFLKSAIAEDRDLAAPTLGGATTRLLAAAEHDDAAFAARCAEDRRHLAAIRAGRESSAAAYFERNAVQWDEMRRLVSDDAPVEAALEGACWPTAIWARCWMWARARGAWPSCSAPMPAMSPPSTRARRCCASRGLACSICRLRA